MMTVGILHLILI